MRYRYNCAGCGGLFETDTKNKKFCSSICLSEFRRGIMLRTLQQSAIDCCSNCKLKEHIGVVQHRSLLSKIINKIRYFLIHLI